MPTKKFTKNNQSFTCINCGEKVEKHPTSSRDHCTHCLYGQHVDINPGDRRNECHGTLEPIGLKMRSDKNQIVYRCEKCKEIAYCIVAPDDNEEKIIELSKKVW